MSSFPEWIYTPMIVLAAIAIAWIVVAGFIAQLERGIDETPYSESN